MGRHSMPIDGLFTRAEIVPGATPRRFAVAITNGSGVRHTEITASSYLAAGYWTRGWAADQSAKTGEAWRPVPVEYVGLAR